MFRECSPGNMITITASYHGCISLSKQEVILLRWPCGTPRLNSPWLWQRWGLTRSWGWPPTYVLPTTAALTPRRSLPQEFHNTWRWGRLYSWGHGEESRAHLHTTPTTKPQHTVMCEEQTVLCSWEKTTVSRSVNHVIQGDIFSVWCCMKNFKSKTSCHCEVLFTLV